MIAEIDQTDRAGYEQIAERIEQGLATPADLAIVLDLLPTTRGGNAHERQPRLDSADDFQTWAVRPGYDGLNEIHVDQSGESHVVGYHHEAHGQGYGTSHSIGAAMWASYVRATGCPEVVEEEDERKAGDPCVHVVSHKYQIGNLSVAVEVPAGLDAKRTCAFIQLACEEWYDIGAVLLPQTVVEALIRFYGCSPAPMPTRIRFDDEIDLYYERESFAGDYLELMADVTTARDGLREFLAGRYES